MKKVIIVNGLIGGAIVSVMMLVTQPLLSKGILNFDNGMVIGYGSMVIALSLIFFGIKTYRDEYQNGSVTFWQGCKVGLGIALIASMLYAITWEAYYNLADHDFARQYTEHFIKKLEADGATAEEIANARAEMAKSWEMYKNPLYRFAFTMFVEMFPVGVIITLLSAGILRRRQVLPA